MPEEDPFIALSRERNAVDALHRQLASLRSATALLNSGAAAPTPSSNPSSSPGELASLREAVIAAEQARAAADKARADVAGAEASLEAAERSRRTLLLVAVGLLVLILAVAVVAAVV